MSNVAVITGELFWAAGFWDGEGCTLLIRPTKGRPYAYASLRTAQVDREVLDRLTAALGLGTVAGPYPKKGENSRDQFHWHTTKKEDVERFLVLMLPRLSSVKREQLLAVARQDTRGLMIP